MAAFAFGGGGPRSGDNNLEWDDHDEMVRRAPRRATLGVGIARARRARSGRRVARARLCSRVESFVLRPRAGQHETDQKEERLRRRKSKFWMRRVLLSKNELDQVRAGARARF